MSAARTLPVVVDDAPIAPSRTRADCVDGPRPCVIATCRYHLPRIQPREMYRRPLPPQSQDSCVLDAIDQHGAMTLAEVGQRLHVGRERVRQIQDEALSRLRIACARMGIDPTLLLVTWGDRRG